MRRTGGGGHGTAGGIDFQVLAAAWFVVGMLAETDFEPPWGWPRDTTIESVRAETREATDDIFVGTSGLGQAFLQAKSSVSLSPLARSEFAKTMQEFAPFNTSCTVTAWTVGGLLTQRMIGWCSRSVVTLVHRSAAIYGRYSIGCATGPVTDRS